MATGVAGLMPVDCKKVTNIDLGSIVTGHTEYYQNLTEILKFVGVKTKESYAFDAEGYLKKSISEIPPGQENKQKEVRNFKFGKSERR